MTTVPPSDAHPSIGTSHYILVHVDAHPRCELLLHRAKTEAQQIGSSWGAIFVETPGYFHLNDEQKNRTQALLQRCKAMNGDVFHITAATPAEGLHDFVRDHPVSQIMIGTSSQRWYERILKPSLHDELLRRGDFGEVRSIHLDSASGRRQSTALNRISVHNVMGAAILITAAVVISELIQAFAIQTAAPGNTHNIIMVFLVAALVAATRYGMIVGVATAICSFTLAHYLYIQPDPQILGTKEGAFVTLLIFLLTSAFLAFIGGYNRNLSETLRRRERLTNSLYTISSTVFSAGSAEDTAQVLRTETSKLIDAETDFLLPELMHPDELVVPDSANFTDIERRAIEHSWREGVPCGLFSNLYSESVWHFEPMLTSNGRIGVFALSPSSDAHFGRPDLQLVKALADLSALAIERSLLSHQMEQSKITQEREKLRSALLSSVSHDLKTPLASIIGSLSAIRHMANSLTEEARQTLMETALSEAERLNRFITNILDMTRLEAQEIRLNKSDNSIHEMIARVTKRLRFRLNLYQIETRIDHPDYEVDLDGTLIEQVLQNLIDNAMKYSPESSKLIFESTVTPSSDNRYVGEWHFSVIDEGPGIPVERRIDIFNKYTRLRHGDNQVAGTGLGLAICKAIIEMHDGGIEITENPYGDTGTRFMITLPGVNLRHIDLQYAEMEKAS